MANTFSTQLLRDGPRNTVIKVEGILDTSDLALTVIADPAVLQSIDFNNVIKASKLRILDCSYSIQDTLTVNLLWDATTPVRIGELTGRGDLKSRLFGGFVNNAGAGVTGKILMSTSGWSTIKSFWFVLELIKQQT